MTVSAVIGLGFGDEGKGVVTEYLCSRSPSNTIVVRFSGGHQCGHKVIKGDTEHIFANFGSGTLSGCPTFWSKHCTFEPRGFWYEYYLLREKGANPRITIHPDCPVTTVYDIFVNQSSIEVDHGTTGTGFFRTKKRHFQDDVRFTVRDLLFGTVAEVVQKLEEIRRYYGIDNLNLTTFYEAQIGIHKLVVNKAVTVADAPTYYDHTVFEGGQGLMLDEKIGTMPHCSPSDVTPCNAMAMAPIDEVYLVSRVYQTRHGNGPMTNTSYRMSLVNTEKETNGLHAFQGEFRTSVLDLDQLIYAKERGIDAVVPAGTKVNLVLTCADQVSLYEVTHGRKDFGGRVFAFDDIVEFAAFIGEKLKLTGDLYVNTSPLSTTVRRISEWEGPGDTYSEGIERMARESQMMEDTRPICVKE